MRRKKKNRVTSPFYYVNPADYGIHDAAVAYQGGGGVKPSYVNDPKDPRLKAYKDSLDLYNYGLDAYIYYKRNSRSKPEFFGKTVLDKKLSEESPTNDYFTYPPNGNSYYAAHNPDNLNNPDRDKISRYYSNKGNIDPEFGVMFRNGTKDDKWDENSYIVPFYKKPVQPVVYQSKQKPNITPQQITKKKPTKQAPMRGGQDFPPVDHIMGPAGQTLYRKDFAPEVWNKMAPTRKPVTFQHGGEIPNQAYLGLQQAAKRYWNQGGYDPHQRPNVATGQADYVPIESLILPATPMIRGIGKVGNMVVDAINPLSGIGKSKFKSEIDWAKWNPETPNYPELIKEYNTIEKSTKKAGTWMKNPDGSAFQGTPEQFVQQNSSNFKKAFPNIVRDNNGYIQTNYHGSPNVLDRFDPQKEINGRIYGDGVYTTPSKELALKYSNGDNPQMYELYLNANRPRNASNYVKEGVEKAENKLNDVLTKYGENSNEYKDALKIYDDDIEYIRKNRTKIDLRKHKIDNNSNEDFMKVKDIQVTPFDNYPKSMKNNNGMFDMTNPNIYKGLVPVIGGAAYLNKDRQYQTGGIIPNLSDNTRVSEQQLQNQSLRPWFKTQYPRQMTQKEVFDETIIPALQFGLNSAMLPRVPRSFNNIYQEEFTNKLKNLQPRNYIHTPNKWLHTNDNFGVMTPGTVNNKIKNKQGGIIQDNQGQYNHPGKVTKINSNNITMKGINYPVLGIPDNGNPQLMQPNQNYYFPNANNVTEYPMIRNYKRGGRVFYDMAIPRYDDGAIITTAAGTTYTDPYQTGPTMQDGSFSTQGNPGTGGVTAGQVAGYAGTAVAGANALQTTFDKNASTNQKAYAQEDAVVSGVSTIYPVVGGFWAAGNAIGRPIRNQLEATDENGKLKNKNSAAIGYHLNNNIFNPVGGGLRALNDPNATTIDKVTSFMPLSGVFNKGAEKRYLKGLERQDQIQPETSHWAYNTQVAADGGQVRPTVINVEKNELEVDKNGNIVKDFTHLPPHPETGINPDGTVMATPGNTIISKNLSKKYLTSDKAQRDRIINTLVLAQQIRDRNEQVPMKKGGKVKYSNVYGNPNGNAGKVTYDPYMGDSFDPDMSATPEEQAIIDQQMASRFGNSFVPRNPNYVAPQAMIWNPEVGPRMEDGTFSTQGYAGDPVRETGWSKVGNTAYNMLPYIGDAAQMVNAIFSKPKHGSRLRNSLGMKYLDTLGGKYNPAAEARANREAYLAARGSIRDLTGGSTGSYLSGMSNLSSNAYKANSDIYTRAHNIDMENAYRKAEYARALGTEDAQYQGLYEQDKLMAEAKRREMIFGPMQNMGKTALLQDQYSRLYPRYRRRGGRV